MDKEADIRTPRRASLGQCRCCYWLALSLLLILPISVVYMASVVRVGIPWGDDITILLEMRFDQGLKPSTLFKFSNEHQIFFTRITLFGDYLLFKGAHVFTTFVAVLLAFFIPVACAASFRFLGAKPPASDHWPLVGAFLLTVYCNGVILWSLTAPVLLQHLFTAAFAVVAGYAFSLVAAGITRGAGALGSAREKRLAAVFVGATTLATVSGANGLLIVPAALAVSILLFSDRSLFSRLAPWKLIVPLLAWAIGLLGTYPSSTEARDGWRHPMPVSCPLWTNSFDLRFISLADLSGGKARGRWRFIRIRRWFCRCARPFVPC